MFTKKLLGTAPTFDEYRQIKRFDELDGMRAIGVILVIFEHYGGAQFKWLSGWLGVHIFFVMSGFLITTLLLREQEKNAQVSLRNFYIRRIFRIFPVYYLILAITIAQTYVLGGESWEQLKQLWPYYAIFLNEQTFVVAPWKITWTMGVEWKFYLLWPLLIFFFPLSPKRMGLITISTLLILSYLWGNQFVIPVHYIVLLLGAIVAILLHHRNTFDILRYLMNPIASLLLFVSVGVMQTQVIQRAELAVSYGGAQGVLYYGIVVAVFLPTLMGNSPINKILQSRPLAFVGHRSYSLYLIQILAWQAAYGINAAAPSGGMAVLTCVVGLIFADSLYRCVEMPMIAKGKQLILKSMRDAPASRT
jgi:peptidoglycan/LPS O-acetylase OafA/YrhL